MSPPIIIGAGHNGLTAAFYLAKAGLKPIVLERSDVVGGGAITTAVHPGFRCPTLTHSASIRVEIAREMNLAAHGLELLTSSVEVFAPAIEGPGLLLDHDARRAAHSIRSISARDAERYGSYRQAIDRISAVLAKLVKSEMPRLEHPGAADVWRLLIAGRAFRALGKNDAYRLLRWVPMAVADLVEEWFESDILRATLAARGVSGGMLGPRSAGSALVLLLTHANTMLNAHAGRVKGGPGAMTSAMAHAARVAGAEIRTNVPVEQIQIRDDRVTGVVAGGQLIQANSVVSAVDPKTTFLRLVDPLHLPPDFIRKIQHYRSVGTLAKINLALSALPRFPSAGDEHSLSGHLHIGPGINYLDRAFDHAKYGELSANPWLDVTIPSILDSSLAPAGAHVMSIYAHYAPYQLRDSTWQAMRDPLLSRVLNTLERVAPGVSRLVLAAEVITPQQLEADYGFSGGHTFHGELAIDQLFTMRPSIGYSHHNSPITGLFLCGAGTHPGGFMSGLSGKLAAREVLRQPRVSHLQSRP